MLGWPLQRVDPGFSTQKSWTFIRNTNHQLGCCCFTGGFRHFAVSVDRPWVDLATTTTTTTTMLKKLTRAFIMADRRWIAASVSCWRPQWFWCSLSGFLSYGRRQTAIDSNEFTFWWLGVFILWSTGRFALMYATPTHTFKPLARKYIHAFTLTC